MKKINLLIGLMLVFALVLTACNTNDNNMTDQDLSDAQAPGLGLTDDDVFGDQTQADVEEDQAETAIIPETGNDDMDDEEPIPTEDLSGAEVIPQISSVDTGRLAQLLDYDVVTMDNEEVGEIEDLIINLEQQKIEYALVEVGGFLGIGEKEVAVPFTEFTIATIEDDGLFADGREAVFTYAGDVAMLENAPEFDEDVLPGLYDDDMNFDDWDFDFRSLWTNDDDEDDLDMDAIPANQNLKGITLASELIDLKVFDDTDLSYNEEDDDKEEIGTITDIIVDPQNGKLRYLVIELEDMDGMDDRYTPVPLYAPYAPYATYDDDVVLVISADLLQNAPYFGEDAFPVTTEQGWEVEYDNYWNNLQ